MFHQSRETFDNMMAQHASLSCSRSHLYPHEEELASTDDMIRFKDVDEPELRRLWAEMRQSLS